MSEFNQIRNVKGIDSAIIFEPYERKAVLAMQATVLFGSEGFENANNDLAEAVSEIGAAATMTYEDLILVNLLETGAKGNGGVADATGYLASKMLQAETNAK